MQKDFDELGVLVAGHAYGSFSGTAMWDHHGDLDVIIIEPQATTAPNVRLDYGQLFRGYATPENTARPTDKQVLWSLLAEALAERFSDELAAFKREREGILDRAERIYSERAA